jgi:hypothetical protein
MTSYPKKKRGGKTKKRSLENIGKFETLKRFMRKIKLECGKGFVKGVARLKGNEASKNK